MTAQTGMPPATSVYFGGGTPSLVPARALVAVLDAIPRSDGAEVTVECNPDTVTADLVAIYRDAGVNRLSFGVQSMVPHVLRSLGRTHDPDNVRRSIALARRVGFDNVNIDLIYGAAGESIDDWASTLDGTLELAPLHVSAYALTVEAGTPFASDASRHPDEDDQAAKYAIACERLEAAGLAWYEISNFARPGRECAHNLLYWRQGEYIGIGCAAHSHLDGRRYWNVRTPERFIDAITAGQSPEAAGEQLDENDRALEALQLALRTRDGVPVDALSSNDVDLRGLTELRGDRLVLTMRGRLLANEVAMRLRQPATAGSSMT